MENHELVCYCDNVTKGEIIAAMEQGAKTLADIKRMTGACCSCKCAEMNPTCNERVYTEQKGRNRIDFRQNYCNSVYFLYNNHHFTTFKNSTLVAEAAFLGY